MEYLMKYLIIFASLFLVYTYTQKADPVVPHAGLNTPIELYSTSWCGYCKKARAFLKENNIRYLEYDIEKDAYAKEKHEQLLGSHKKAGKTGVPLFVVDGKILYGFNPKRLTKAIAQANS